MITKRKIPKLCNIWEENTNRYLETNKGINPLNYTRQQIKLFVDPQNYKTILRK